MITLITDFGTADYYVGAMKGVILSIDTYAHIVDITHEISAFDIEAAAFVVLQSYRSFPPQTIHVAVVDPCVGSERRPILVTAADQFFIGPDNGLFSYIYEREVTSSVIHLTNKTYFRKPVSTTFHGRDIFAAVAGALSKGVEPQQFGNQIQDFTRLAPLAPKVLSSGTLEARIIHVDRFGNCVTNLTRDVLTEDMIAGGVTLQVGDYKVNSFRQYFAETGVQSDVLFGVWGSADFLEIAAFRASAADLLGAKRGQRVVVTFHER